MVFSKWLEVKPSLASTDLDELATICDSILRVFNGRIRATPDGQNLSRRRIVEVVNTGKQP